MVAWKLRLHTPEYPTGRDIVLISNDITFLIGSFGPKEDLVFQFASKLSRELGLPRIYISVNSGARIGLADEVKKRFKVAWIDPNSPDKGYKHLYLTSPDFAEVKRETRTELVKSFIFLLAISLQKVTI